MIDFKTWQQGECSRLGITIEQHNFLLKKSIELAIQTDDFKPYDLSVAAFKLGQRMRENIERELDERINECLLKN